MKLVGIVLLKNLGSLPYITTKFGKIVPSRHGHAKVLSPPIIRLSQVSILRSMRHTTVIGIIGAFGKTKAISSNIPRRRQFWARDILLIGREIYEHNSFTQRTRTNGKIPSSATIIEKSSVSNRSQHSKMKLIN